MDQMKAASRILEMQPYRPIEPVQILAKKSGLPVEKIVKLDANENPYGPSPSVRSALEKLDYINIYPDPESRDLRARLGEIYGVPINNLLAGSGADELIDLLLRVLLDPGDTVINCPPTFGMYPFDTKLNNGECINVFRQKNFSLDLPEIYKAVEKYKPKIIFVCSPNNPDGSLLTEEEFEFLISLPSLIVLDEAYIEFTQQNFDLGAANSHIKQISIRNNLVILRTFSKWAGLAGLRIGFGAFPAWLMESLWKAKQPYNVNIAANTAALVSIKDRANLAKNIGKIQEERVRLSENLAKFTQLSPFPTNSNFILCKVKGISAKLICDSLASRGIFIRYYDSESLQDCIRISVGRPEDSDSLMKGLEAII
jgi:histidinol-phosphate aminotransferase